MLFVASGDGGEFMRQRGFGRTIGRYRTIPSAATITLFGRIQKYCTTIDFESSYIPSGGKPNSRPVEMHNP
ncbi:MULTISPECIES: hypothetical protein [Mycobacterium]|uniref:hypothetical protein n=1 Tax=Mycobacterium TaxID=1763 RepID=UPI001EF144E8|nr:MULTISPECIES: hypothetical protein [Mycobacterium]